MIALDSNVLIRYLVRDDESQWSAAAKLIDRGGTRAQHFYISSVVLAETAWVLRRSFRIPKDKFADAVEAILETTQFQFSVGTDVRRALESYRAGSGDFADYLIKEQALDAGCHAMATFDRNLLAEPYFVSPFAPDSGA